MLQVVPFAYNTQIVAFLIHVWL